MGVGVWEWSGRRWSLPLPTPSHPQSFILKGEWIEGNSVEKKQNKKISWMNKGYKSKALLTILSALTTGKEENPGPQI